MHGIAFAELVVFLEATSSDEDSSAVFRISCLVKLYKDRLENLGFSVDSRIHSIRLKNRLIAKLPELRVHSEGRDILFTFQKNIGSALKKACDPDSDDMIWRELQQWCAEKCLRTFSHLTGHSRLIARRMLYHPHSWF